MLKPRRAATGETRAAASRVPTTNAMMPETAARNRVLRKPSQYWGRLSMMTSMVSFSWVRGKGGKREGAFPGGLWHAQPRVTATIVLVAVDGRKFRCRLDDRAGRVFPGLLVGAVLREGFQLVVDPVAELGVALLQADAVGLLGEGLVGCQLERVRLLVDEACQNDVVRGHGLNLLVAQRFEAGGVGGGRNQDRAVLLHDGGSRGGTRHGADVLALDVLGLGDGRV